MTRFPNRIGLQDWTAPTSPELDDDDVIGWRLVPFFGLVLVFLITKAFPRQGIRRVFQRDMIRQPPNHLAQIDRILDTHSEPVASLPVENARKDIAYIGVPGTNGFHVGDDAASNSVRLSKRPSSPSS